MDVDSGNIHVVTLIDNVAIVNIITDLYLFNQKEPHSDDQMAEKPYHHNNLPKALIDATLDLLRERGVADISLRGVAKAAGVSHTAPYRHFRDKAALLEAAALEGFRELAACCVSAERKYPTEPVKQLTEAGTGYLLMTVSKPQLTHLMFGGILDFDHCSEELKLASQQAYSSLVRIVANGQQSGVFRDGDTAELALAAWSTVHGLALMLVSGFLGDMAASKKKIREIAKIVSEVFYTGLLRR